MEIFQQKKDFIGASSKMRLIFYYLKLNVLPIFNIPLNSKLNIQVLLSTVESINFMVTQFLFYSWVALILDENKF